MEMETETRTEITLDGNYSVDVYLEGEHEWDIATTEAETRIKIIEEGEE